jgi:hypothetical protein
VLLDHLPWNLTTVALPWLATPIATGPASERKLTEGTEAPDLKNGATEITKETEKKTILSSSFPPLAPLLRF